MRTLAPSLVFFFSLTLCGVTSAQVWLEDRDTRDGRGIKLGESLVFHPGAMVEGGYDTNPDREAEDFSGAGRLRITSYLDLTTRNSARSEENRGSRELPKIDFRIGIAGYYDFFFSDRPSIDDQDDFGIDGHFNLVVFPERKFTFLLDGIYQRVVQPYDTILRFHARHAVRPGAGFQFRPGGGTLMLGMKYTPDIALYEDNQLAARYNKVTHDVRLDLAWHVLPKTAFRSTVRFSPTTYLGSSDFNNDSFPVRALVGLRGLLTPKFGLSFFLGYGASFYRMGDDFEGLIANGELMFFVTPFAKIRVGGERDFVDSIYSNFYVRSGGYIGYDQMFGKILLLCLDLDAFHRKYAYFAGEYPEGLGVPQTTTYRVDVWIGVTLMLEFRITQWLSALATAVYQANASDFEFDTPEGTDPAKFHRFEAMGGLRVYY